jgi:hypothetical protein
LSGFRVYFDLKGKMTGLFFVAVVLNSDNGSDEDVSRDIKDADVETTGNTVSTGR